MNKRIPWCKYKTSSIPLRQGSISLPYRIYLQVLTLYTFRKLEMLYVTEPHKNINHLHFSHWIQPLFLLRIPMRKSENFGKFTGKQSWLSPSYKSCRPTARNLSKKFLCKWFSMKFFQIFLTAMDVCFQWCNLIRVTIIRYFRIKPKMIFSSKNKNYRI